MKTFTVSLLLALTISPVESLSDHSSTDIYKRRLASNTSHLNETNRELSVPNNIERSPSESKSPLPYAGKITLEGTVERNLDGFVVRTAHNKPFQLLIEPADYFALKDSLGSQIKIEGYRDANTDHFTLTAFR